MRGRAAPTPAEEGGRVAPGSRGLVGMPHGEALVVRPVHPAGAALDHERVSLTSPLCQALLRRRAARRVPVNAQAGNREAEVLGLRTVPRAGTPERALSNAA